VSNEKRDPELGVHRAIARRDFLNGVRLTIAMSITRPNDFCADMLAAADKPYSRKKEPGYYPPSKIGMRGSHDGWWEVAHAVRDGKAWSKRTPDAESRDLIVVGAGFDPASDIEAINVNRWPHGYAYEYNSLYDPVWLPGQAPNEIGRQPFGRIHIANSDAGAFAYTNEAIDQGYRAVQEIMAKRT
jgi:hypothetical protein